ncbi:hypothetical protein [Streptomyces sp. NBC_00649]|uniref:hypothetical protein n=1 Tax=Streptomyces sp. NBC_00649 TaxID=2975798 RepID=UPI003249AB38
MITEDRYVMARRVGGMLYRFNGPSMPTAEETATAFAYGVSVYAASTRSRWAELSAAFLADPAAIVPDELPDEPGEYLVAHHIVTETRDGDAWTVETKLVRDF